MNKKEFEAMNYSLFRFPTYFSITLFPAIVGVILFYLSGNLLLINDDVMSTISNQRIEKLGVYFTAARLTLIVVISFFVSFRWSSILNDGEYGFWLIQGVDRSKFFIYSFIRFFTTISFGLFIGVIIVIYPGGLDATLLDIFKILFLILSGMYLLSSSAFLIGELIHDPERSLIIYIFIHIFIILITQNTNKTYLLVLFSENQIGNSNSILIIIYSIILSSVMFLISFLIHKKRDIQL